MHIRNILLLPLSCLILCTACGGDKQQDGENGGHEHSKKPKIGPNLAFRELSHRDTLNQGDSAVYRYRFYNSGDEDVIIENVYPEVPHCNPVFPKEPIPHGEETFIELRCHFPDTGQWNMATTVKHNGINGKTMITLHTYVRPAEAE